MQSQRLVSHRPSEKEVLLVQPKDHDTLENYDNNTQHTIKKHRHAELELASS